MTRVRWYLYTDEHIEKSTIDSLRKAGFNVLSVLENPELQGKDDDFHYKNAKRLNKFLVTRDQGFWDNKKYPLRTSPLIIIITNKDSKTEVEMLKAIRAILYSLLSPQGGVRTTQIKLKLSDTNINYQYIDVDTGLEVSVNSTWEEFIR